MFLSDMTEATECAHTDTHSEALCKVRVGFLFVCFFFQLFTAPRTKLDTSGHTTNPM